MQRWRYGWRRAILVVGLSVVTTAAISLAGTADAQVNEPKIVVLGQGFVLGPSGTHASIGAVLRNASSQDAIRVWLVFDMINASGKVTKTVRPPPIWVLPAGQRYYYGYDAYAVRGHPVRIRTRVGRVEQTSPPRYELPKVTARLTSDGQIVGRVRNTLPRTLWDGASLSAVLLDSRGRVLAGTAHYDINGLGPDTGHLRSGQTTTYELEAPVLPPLAKTVRASVENVGMNIRPIPNR